MSTKNQLPTTSYLEQEARDNIYFRDVRPELTFKDDRQFVFMSLPVGEKGHLDAETHAFNNQTFYVVAGEIDVVVDGSLRHPVKAGEHYNIPAGRLHEVFSLGQDKGRLPTQLYTEYAPPIHQAGRLDISKPLVDVD